MAWHYTLHAGILHTTTLISLLLAFLISSRRDTAEAKSLILLVLAVAEWLLASGLEAASVGLEQKILWAKLEYLGAVFAPTLFMLFALEYRSLNRFLAPPYLLLYSFIPLASLIAVLTNEWHGLIWNSFLLGPAGSNSYIYGHGIAFYLLLSYDYLMTLAAITILGAGWLDSRPPYRNQIGIILASSLFPILGSIIFVFTPIGLTGLDPAPVSFLLTGVVIALGIFKFRLFDLVPVARHIIMEYLSDGVLVLDSQNRLADINPAAEKILGVVAEDSLGRPALLVLKD